MKKKINKIIYIIIIIIMFMQNISNVVMAAKVIEISKADLINDHKITTNLQFKHSDGTWHNLDCNYICYTNKGKTYPAYCIKHGVNGVDEEGPYTVEISKLISDNRIWRVIINSYPYITLKEMGVATKDDAYVATKHAINSILMGRNVKTYYHGINKKGEDIVNAIDKLVEIGKNGKQKMQDDNLKTKLVKDLTQYNDNWYYQEYKVTSDVSMESYKITNIKNFPDGTYISDINGNKKSNFSSGENFRIMIEKKNLNTDITGTINIVGKCKTYPVFFGKAPNSDVQDYAITYDPYESCELTGKILQKVNNAKINVYKKDEESLKPIEGVKYNLTQKNGQIVDSKVTDSNGKITFENLYPGKYILQEISTNKNYVIDSTEHEINLEYDSIITKELTNKHKKGNLKIVKVDKDNPDITLGGIEFDLLDEDNKLVAHLYTNADGEALIENINTGNYIIKETRTKKEYNLCVEENVVVKWNETSEIIIENEKKKGQIKVIKEDKDHNEIKISGVEFEVLDKNDRIIEKIVTDKNGEAITSKLPIGEYKIREIGLKNNIKYEINDEIYTVNIENNKIIELHIKNEHKKGKLKIIKVDKDNKSIPIENVKFEITDEDGFKYYTETNKDGIAEISNIRIGKVKIKEIETNKEYVLNKEEFNLEINYNKTSEITIENEKKKGQVEIYKVDKNNERIKLQDVEFEILDLNGNIVDKIKTNKDGYVISKKIPIGEYYLKETKTNKDYILNNEKIKLQINHDEILTLNITNEKMKGRINIIKVSSKDSSIFNIKKGDVLSNVTFEVYDSQNKLVDTLITDENGQAISKELEVGRYKIIEINTLDNFLLNTNEFFVYIEKDNEVKTLEIENEPVIPELNIEKEGKYQANRNEEIEYKFDIKNTGNVDLQNFTWIEHIPYEHVKLTKMVTGTYNYNLNYKIYYKTNKNDYRFFKEVNTKKIEYLDFDNIDLLKNEKITELKMEYNIVPTKFKTIIKPSIFVKINNNINLDDIIVNKTELLGEYNCQQLKDESSCYTKIKDEKIEKKLPRTGC